MIVQYSKHNSDFSDLTLYSQYVVIGIEADDYRILNDQGKPYLYPYSLFEVVDAREPTEWVTEFGDDGERYAYPPNLNAPGFFEDFFDSKLDVVASFWRTINQQLAVAAV